MPFFRNLCKSPGGAKLPIKTKFPWDCLFAGFLLLSTSVDGPCRYRHFSTANWSVACLEHEQTGLAWDYWGPPVLALLVDISAPKPRGPYYGTWCFSSCSLWIYVPCAVDGISLGITVQEIVLWPFKCPHTVISCFWAGKLCVSQKSNPNNPIKWWINSRLF